MIHKAKFQNFKALRDVEVTFDSRLTVLVGPNGSGKTSVLRGIALLNQVACGLSVHEVLKAEWSPAYTRPIRAAAQVIEAESSVGNGPNVRVRITVRDDAGNKNGWEATTETTVLKRRNAPEGVNPHNAPPHALRSVEFLRLDPTKIAAPSTIRLPAATAPDGTGSASTLAFLHRRDPARFKKAVDSLKQVVPNVVDLHVDYEVDGGAARDALVFDFPGVTGARAASASTGTLLVVGLLSVLFGPNSPNVLLLDDLDYALHPKGQMELVGLLRGVLDEFPDLQIIATAHSPYILDKLQWNEVRVTSLKSDGSAICKPLTDHPDFDRWKESMSPGEFWTTFYEDWLTKTRKPQAVP